MDTSNWKNVLKTRNSEEILSQVSFEPFIPHLTDSKPKISYEESFLKFHAFYNLKFAENGNKKKQKLWGKLSTKKKRLEKFEYHDILFWLASHWIQKEKASTHRCNRLKSHKVWIHQLNTSNCRCCRWTLGIYTGYYKHKNAVWQSIMYILTKHNLGQETE